MEIQYSLFAMDWDYESPNSIREINKRQCNGILCPCADIELLEHCGALPGFKKERVLAMAKKLKKQYPFVQWAVYEGKSWGELKLVQMF